MAFKTSGNDFNVFNLFIFHVHGIFFMFMKIFLCSWNFYHDYESIHYSLNFPVIIVIQIVIYS